MGRIGPRGLLVADAAAAAGVLGSVAIFRAPEADLLAWIVAAMLSGPLIVRRRRPVAVLFTVTVVGTAAIIVGNGNEVVALSIAWALYPVGLASARSGIAGVGAALTCVTAAGVVVVALPGVPLIPARAGSESFGTTPVSAMLSSAILITGSWMLAASVRLRRQQAAELAELRAGQAVAEERLRIARDIHDVVGHNLSLIAMKAAVANHLAASRPGEREMALHTIEKVSRSALADVRTVVGALRDPSATPPITAGLDQLVEDARVAGVTVTVDQGDLAWAPAAVRVSAYRIVQEALTNVRRHSHPPRCRLTTTVEDGRLVISVVDEGTAPVTIEAPGHGLLGMRERVALHGGTLHAEAVPGGGFAVRATLPFNGAAS
jgi:signal transduction histidine kinase